MNISAAEKSNNTTWRRAAGFTIVELLIVIVVIAILAAITLVSYAGVRNRATVAAAQANLKSATEKVKLYALQNNGMYPASAAAAGLADSGNTTYWVSSDNTVSPSAYCVTVTVDKVSYFQTTGVETPTQGTCKGLLAWWPFDGDAKDASGNGIDGTVMGATLTNGADGTENSAYQLGVTSMYINVGTPAKFSVVPSGFTYSIWLQRTGTSTGQWPQIMGSSNTHLDFGIRSSNYGNTIYFEWGISPFDSVAYTGSGNSGDASSTSAWHLATVTYDGTNVRVYWDGTLKYTSSATSVRPTMANFGFTTSSSGWVGKIDDARVYSRPLSGDEVQTMYKAGAQ